MKPGPERPPRLAAALMRLLGRLRPNAAVADDLEEEYAAEVQAGGGKRARRAYRRLFLTSLPSILGNTISWSAAMIRNYFRIAARNTVRNRLFAAINLGGLALGMACFILISLWVRDELGYDDFHVFKKRLFLLTIRHPSGQLDPNAPYALADLLAREYPEIEAYTRILEYSEMTTCALRSQTAGGEDRMFYEDRVILADPEFFSLFSFPIVHGRAENALLNPDAVVLAEATAAKYFGRENPVGKKLTLNNRRDMTVTAVVRIPPRSSIQFDVLAPLGDRMSQNWNWSDPSYLLLNEGADLDAFREKIAGTMERLAPYPDAGRFRADVLPLERVHLEFGRRAYVRLFSLIAGFILVLACINYMNLATASAGVRAREVGLRKVVGAARPQLILQFLSESVLTAAAALIPAVLLVYVGLPWMNRLTGKQLVLPLFSAPRTFPELLALVVLVGAAAGLYPALFLSARRPVSNLKPGFSTGSSRSPLRVAAVVGQFSLSVLLIAAALGAERQIQFIRNRPLGLSTRSVLQLRLNPQLLARFQTFKRELLRNPRVLSVTSGQSVPYAEDYKTGGLDWDGKPEGFNVNVRYSIAHFDYFKTFDIQIAEGRSFSEENPTDRNQFLINQAAARYMGMEEPLGQRLEFWNREGQIIGVVRDYHHVSLHREIMPQIFTINPVFYNALRLVFIKMIPTEIPNTMEFIRDTTRRFAPGYPVEAVFLDEGTASLYENERRVGRLFSGFALLAVLISGLGIFGLSAFIAGQRTKEIGVRKILGASEAGIVGLLSRNFARWALLANLIAWPLAYFGLHHMLQSYAYRTKITIDLFLAAGLISLAAAAIPGAYHALRAARTDPVRSLRYE